MVIYNQRSNKQTGNEGGNSLTALECCEGVGVGSKWKIQRYKREYPIQLCIYYLPSSHIEGNFAVPCVCECDAVQQIIIQALRSQQCGFYTKDTERQHARILF